MKLTTADLERYRKSYSSDELLRMALNMLDEAAKEQRGKKRWLSNNRTLEVIRDRVETNNITVVSLDNPAELHSAIQNALGE